MVFLIPFTQAQLLDVCRQYNEGIGMALAPVMMVAAVGLCFAFWDNLPARRVVNGSLAFVWLWMAVVFCGRFLSRSSGLAWPLAAVFVIQACVFLWGAWRGTIHYRFSNSVGGWLGALTVVYALCAYVAINFSVGQYFPAAPTFGVPSPTILFTLGLLMWSNANWRVLAIPVVAGLLCAVAAVGLPMPQDYPLAIALLVPFVVRPSVIQRQPLQ